MKKSNDFENFDENSQVEVEIEPEKLFYNMLAADASTCMGFLSGKLFSVRKKWLRSPRNTRDPRQS